MGRSLSILSRAKRKYQSEGAKPLIRYLLGRPLSIKWLTIGLVTSYALPSLRRHEMQKYKVVDYSRPDAFVAKEYQSDQKIPFLDRVNGEYSFEQPFVAEIENATIIKDYGFAVNTDGVILESLRARRNQFGKLIAKDKRIIQTVREKRKKPPQKQYDFDLACSLIDAGSYHLWVMKGLTRLEGIERYTERTGEKPQLLLPPNPSSYITESLELFGYTPDEWTEWDRSETTIKRLVVPTHRSQEDWTSQYASPLVRNVPHKVISPSAIRWVRQTAAESIDNSSEPRRIFIIRTDIDERRIVNRSEVMDMLKEYGFESYALGELSFKRQVELFHSADCIVGTHGAGFANQIFATDCTVFEFMSRHFKPTYYLLSSSCGHKYAAMECETINTERNDIRVDIPKLTEYMDSFNLEKP